MLQPGVARQCCSLLCKGNVVTCCGKAMLQPDSDPASKPLVDEVNAVLDNNAQKQSAAGGKPVDLSKPLGKIKGALYKKGQRKQGDP